MRKDIEKYVRSCETCQRNKATCMKPAGLFQPLPAPTRNWKHISMDLVVQLPHTARGHDAILVFVDKLSKMGRFRPTKTSLTAPELAMLFFKEIFREKGLPSLIISDRDPKFTSKFWKELHKILHVKLALSSAFHPQI